MNEILPFSQPFFAYSQLLYFIQIFKAAKALLDYVNREKEGTSGKKPLWEEEGFIFLSITLHKIPEKSSHTPLMM